MVAIYPPCIVCDGPGNGIHYGYNTCDACKGFFHRSLQYDKHYKCSGKGNCLIRYGTGKMCKQCRYRKCIAMGLSKKAIKRGRYKMELKRDWIDKWRRENGTDGPHHESSRPSVKLEDDPDRKLTIMNQSGQTSYSDNLSSSCSAAGLPPLSASTNTIHTLPVSTTSHMIFDGSTCHLSNSGSSSQLSYSGSTSQLSNSGSNSQLSYSGSNSQLSYSGSNSQLSYSGSNSQLPYSGSNSQLSYRGSNSQLSNSGFNSQLSYSGSTSQLSNSGSSSQLSNSGSNSQLSNSGSNNQLSYSGSTSQLSNSGSISQLSNSGSNNQLSYSGSTSQLSNSGSNSQLSNSESNSQLSNSGSDSQLSNIESNSQLSNSGSTSYLSDIGATSQLSNSESTGHLSDNGAISHLSNNAAISHLSNNGTTTIHEGHNTSPSGASCRCPETTLSSSSLSPHSAVSCTNPNASISKLSDLMDDVKIGRPAETVILVDYDQKQHNDTVRLGTKCVNQDILAMYTDGDQITKTLISAYETAFGSHIWTPEEAEIKIRQHYEDCKHQTEMFGHLRRLPDEEYDMFYLKTGIDADGRKSMLAKFSANVENYVRMMVTFLKEIPGFSILETDDKVNVLKYSRIEFSYLLNYTCASIDLGVYRNMGRNLVCAAEAMRDNMTDVYTDFLAACKHLQDLQLCLEERVLLSAISVMCPDRFEPTDNSLVPHIHAVLSQLLMDSLRKRRPDPKQMYSRLLEILSNFRHLEKRIKAGVRNWGLDKYGNVSPCIKDLIREQYGASNV